MIRSRPKIFGANKSAPDMRKRMDVMPGQMILRIKHQAVPHPGGGARFAFASSSAREFPAAIGEPIEWLNRNYGIKKIEPIYSERGVEFRSSRVRGATTRARLSVQSSVFDSSNEDLRGFNVITIKDKRNSVRAMRRLGDSSAVEFVEAMPARWIQARSGADPEVNRQWGLRAVKWFEIDSNAPDVTVGVMDTGVDATHPALKGAIAKYFHPDRSRGDLLAHGTHVCGFIAAAANNDEGIAGMAACRLAVWKIFGDEPAQDGEFYVDGTTYLKALGEAANAGLRVLNLSIGGTQRSQAEQLLFGRLERANVVVCAAMGNEFEEGNPIEYPAGYKGVLAVGSVDETLERSSFSNTGRHLGLVAPGANILSTVPTRRTAHMDRANYDVFSGTSMATPHVAGAAALVAARHPAWTAVQIKAHLIKTAAPVAGSRRGRHSREYGSGLLDLQAALA
jgi:subtilisin family serine protease